MGEGEAQGVGGGGVSWGSERVGVPGAGTTVPCMAYPTVASMATRPLTISTLCTTTFFLSEPSHNSWGGEWCKGGGGGGKGNRPWARGHGGRCAMENGWYLSQT